MAYKLLTSILFFTLLNNANLRILSKDSKSSVENDLKTNLPTPELKNEDLTVESNNNTSLKAETPKLNNLDKAKFEHLPMLGNNVSQEKKENVIQVDSNPTLSTKQNEMLKVVEQELVNKVNEDLNEKMNEENKILTNEITEKLEQEFVENKNNLGQELVNKIGDELENKIDQEIKKLTNSENNEERKDPNSVKVVSIMLAIIAFCFTLF